MFQFEDVEYVQVHLKRGRGKKRVTLIWEAPDTVSLTFDQMRFKTMRVDEPKTPNAEKKYKKDVPKRKRKTHESVPIKDEK